MIKILYINIWIIFILKIHKQKNYNYFLDNKTLFII
jgi:hypothetical protein